MTDFEEWWHNEGSVAPQQDSCEFDTDGDGNCHLCARIAGECIHPVTDWEAHCKKIAKQAWEEATKNISTPDAMQAITKELQKDYGYTISWHSNIAMMCLDAIQENAEESNRSIALWQSMFRDTANEAAAKFMKLCFDVDSTKAFDEQEQFNQKLMQFIETIADKKPSDISNDNAMCYYSKVDGSYLTREGMEDNLAFLLKNGITEQIQNKGTGKVANIGFNPEEQKWYGWSHRAIYGFGIGSTCKKGDCHYRAANLEDEIEAAIRFWTDDHKENVRYEKSYTDKEGNNYLKIAWEYDDTVPNEDLRGTTSGTDWYFDPENYGRGEWTANTLEEARQMACDFAEGVG